MFTIILCQITYLHIRAKRDRGALEDLCTGGFVDVNQLHVSAAPTALSRMSRGALYDSHLSDNTLRHRVEADQFELILLCGHFRQDFAERSEGLAGLVDIDLVHLIGHEQDVLLVAELDDL